MEEVTEQVECGRCGANYNPNDRLQSIRHENAFCVTSRGRDNSPEATKRRRDGALRGWAKRRQEREP
jgi:hypothetical protein